MRKMLTNILAILLLAATLLSPIYIKRAYSLDPIDIIIFVDHDWVNDNDVQEAINTYMDDLEAEGWSCVRYNATVEDMSEGPEWLRNGLENLYTQRNCTGAIFVGDFPTVKWEHGINGPYEWYYTDYYYMDLDGNWTDRDEDGIFDLHSNETGDLTPEIWVGRLKASNIDGNEKALFLNYFAKNHVYRNVSARVDPAEDLSTNPKGLIYIDNDPAILFVEPRNSSAVRTYDPQFVNMSLINLQKVYANVTMVASPILDDTNTNATHYKTLIGPQNGYEFVWFMGHGIQGEHGFDKYDWEEGDHWRYVCMPSEGRASHSYYLGNDTKAFFYIFIQCQGACFTSDNCVANAAIFGNGSGLVSIGQTTDWSPRGWYFNETFEVLQNNSKCIGEGFMAMYDTLYNYWGDSFPRYMVLLGDPTLRINSPPYAPAQPSGTEQGEQRKSYSYSANTTDLNGDQIWYQFDWDDGTYSTIGPYNSGQSGNKDHTWQEPGTYYVRARAKDSNEVWGDWSPNLTVTITERVRFMQNAKWDSTYWKLYWNNTSTYTYWTKTQYNVAYSAKLGVKIYKVNDNETLLTDDEPNDILTVGTRYKDDNEIKNVTWNCSEQNVTDSYIKVEVWYKFSSSSWAKFDVDFKTETFGQNTMLNATTWNVYLWGSFTYEFGPLGPWTPPGSSKARIRFDWGSSARESRIKDMTFTSG